MSVAVAPYDPYEGTFEQQGGMSFQGCMPFQVIMPFQGCMPFQGEMAFQAEMPHQAEKPFQGEMPSQDQFQDEIPFQGELDAPAEEVEAESGNRGVKRSWNSSSSWDYSERYGEESNTSGQNGQEADSGYWGKEAKRAKLAIPCRFFMRGPDVCRNGDQCKFSHDMDLIMAAHGTGGNSAAASRLALRPGYKSQICRFWVQGTCMRGQLCAFAHGAEELRGDMTEENMQALSNRQETERRMVQNSGDNVPSAFKTASFQQKVEQSKAERLARRQVQMQQSADEYDDELDEDEFDDDEFDYDDYNDDSADAPEPELVLEEALPVGVVSTGGGRPQAAQGVCKWYMLGECWEGENCKYAHTGPTITGDGTPMKRNICRWFLLGECWNGASCQYEHTVDV